MMNMDNKKLLLHSALAVTTIILFTYTQLLSSSASSASSTTVMKSGSTTSSASLLEQQRPTKYQCVSLKDELKKIIQSSDQILIPIPAKAGGQSLGNFTRRCLNIPRRDFITKPFTDDNKRNQLITKSYELQPFVANHVAHSQHLVDLIMNTSDGTLVIAMYRKETERLLSAIRHLIKKFCSKERAMDPEVSQNFQYNGQRECTINEQTLVDRVIAIRRDEIGWGIPEIFPCGTFDKIEELRPNMILINYKQMDELQALLAEKYCTDLLEDLPLPRVNTAQENDQKVFVQLVNQNGKVLLDEWLEKKKNLLEFALKLRKNSSCYGKVRQMEHDLLRCADETILLSS